MRMIIISNTLNSIKLQAELERGDTPTSMHCYMSEYNMTEDQARKEIWNLINKSWKELNEGLGNCSPLSLFFGKTAMNLARVIAMGLQISRR